MKHNFLFLFFGMTLFYASVVSAQDPIVVNTAKKTFFVQETEDQDFTVYGYEKMDTESTKLICFSNLTADVEENPNDLELGAYYTSDDLKINYLGTEGDFIKLMLMDEDDTEHIFFIEKKSVAMQ